MSNNIQTQTAEEQLKELIEKTEVDRTEEYKQYYKVTQKALHDFLQSDPFYANMLQELDFKGTYDIERAALCWIKEKRKLEVHINPSWFLTLPKEQRVGVLHHEVLHLVGNHIFRLEFKAGPTNSEDNMYKNIAADMAINQYIKDLPPDGINVDDFKLEDGVTPFPKWRTSEEYFKLLKIPEVQKQNSNKMRGLGESNGTTIDEHKWGELSDEEKKELAKEMKAIIKRTMEKTSYGMDKLPGGLKELLEEVENFIKGMDYRRILRDAIKRHASSQDRENSWKRPNKRVGSFAPGTTLGKLPKLNIYVDTSGSISVKELNIFLRVIDGFLKAGERKCMLGLWHTKMYYLDRYRLRQKFKADEVQSGGTDLVDVIKHIDDSEPDLSIILTDGYYGEAPKPKGQTVFIISDGGDMNHHLHKECKTISLKGLTK